MIALLYLVFGWSKFDYGAIVQQMTQAGVPLPAQTLLL